MIGTLAQLVQLLQRSKAAGLSRRDMILEARLPDGERVEVPGIVPKLSLTPGQVRRPAPLLGADTEAVLEAAGVSASAVAELRAKGVI